MSDDSADSVPTRHVHLAMPDDSAGMRLLSRSSYGSADSHPTAEPPSDEHALGWEERGGLWHLNIEFSMTVGKQFIALSMVLVQVYTSRSLLMSCDSRKIGVPVAVLCEYTKAYVRCFPLLAIVVSLIVASRMLLCQRMYYKVLKKRAILDFKKFYPGKDQLFLVVSWSAFNAFLHFALELSTQHPVNAAALKKLSFSEKALIAEIRKVASLYVLPSLVFLAFLWQAYDEEARLLPLSKYFEEDPEAARKTLASMHFLPENVAARVVKKHEIHFKDSDGRHYTSDEVFTSFVKQCKSYSGTQSMRLTEGALEQISHVHLISGMWPGKLLLDDRLVDESSANFRLYWFGCSAIGICIMVGILALLVQQSWWDVHDIREGQISDLAALFVQIAHAMVLLFLGPSFIKHAILPYIKTFRKYFK